MRLQEICKHYNNHPHNCRVCVMSSPFDDSVITAGWNNVKPVKLRCCGLLPLLKFSPVTPVKVMSEAVEPF